MSGAAVDQHEHSTVLKSRADTDPTAIGLSLEGLTIRPIRPDDKVRLQEFFGTLSPSTVALRFLGGKKFLSQAELAFFADVDFVHHVAFVATLEEDGNQRIIGTARYVILPGDDDVSDEAEFAITVADEFQGRGVGRLLLAHLIQAAWVRGVRTAELLISAGNTNMLKMVRQFGHVISRTPEAGAYHVRCSLEDPAHPARKVKG